MSTKSDKSKEMIPENYKYLPSKISKKTEEKIVKKKNKHLNFKLESFKLSESLNGVHTHHCIHTFKNIKFYTLGKT